MFVRKPDKRYIIEGSRCPDCGPVSLEPDAWMGATPESALCPKCGERVFFFTPIPRSRIKELDALPLQQVLPQLPSLPIPIHPPLPSGGSDDDYA